MKAELVYGKLIRIENDTLTLVVDGEEVQYTIGIEELSEDWIVSNLGNYVNVVLIDGKVKGFSE